jgi:uncharacterized membrane protein YphA (DoxX/SURF4 family)
MQMSILKKIASTTKKVMFVSPWPYRLVRVCLGAIFVFSGVVKLVDPKRFARTISEFGLLPEILLAPAAIGLPAVELLAGLGLILDIRGSLSLIFGMLIMFIFVLWFGILKGLDIDCGCFSIAELKDHASLRDAFHRDVVMVAAVLYLYLARLVRTDFKTRPGLWAKLKSIC